MQSSSEKDGWWLASALSLAACLVFAFCFTLIIPIDVLRLGDKYPAAISGDQLIIWHEQLVFQWRWLLVAAAVLLPLAAWVVTHIALARGPGMVPAERHREWIRRLQPVALLPLAAAARLFADVLPPSLVSNAALYLPLAVLAATLARSWPAAPAAGVPAPRDTRWNVLIVLVATLLFSALGWHLSVTVGEHVGDEGHYMVQAESLHRDHDLDIRNQLLKPGSPGESDLSRLHVAPNSRGGHLYSYHPYGLPLLLAPFWSSGMYARYLVLAFVSALGCVGMFRISRRAGAGPLASVVAVAGLGGSVFWALYSARVLPEVLGATLLVWIFWAVLAQTDRPWTATIVAAACCACLPHVHLRFLPMSLMGMGFFGLLGLCGRQPWPRKLVRLTVFSLLCSAGYIAFLAIQQSMFMGDSAPASAPSPVLSSPLSFCPYPAFQVLFTFPLGMWAAIADSRGLLSVLPVFVWLGAALIVWPWVDRKQRFFAISLLVTVLACLLTSCTNDACIGGSCVPGRYLLIVAPLLVPAGAVMLERGSTWARGWFLFLGLMSTGILLLILIHLPDIGRSFIVPVSALSGLAEWRGLFHPYGSVLYWSAHATDCFWTTLYVLTGLGASLVLIPCPSLRHRTALIVLLAVLVVGGIAHRIRVGPDEQEFQPAEIARRLLALNLDRARVTRLPGTTRPQVVGVRIATAGTTNKAGLLLSVPPRDDWRYLDPAALVEIRDTEGKSCREALTDAVMDTHWTGFVELTNAPTLTLDFGRPVPLCGIRLLSPNDLYPRRVSVDIQGSGDASWKQVLPLTRKGGGFWSGQRLMPEGSQFFQELRVAVPTGGVNRVRLTFYTGGTPYDVRLAEIFLLEQAPPPDGELPSAGECLAALRLNGVKQFYGPRWVSDHVAQVAKNGMEIRVPSLIPCSAEEWATYDPERPQPVVVQETTGFMMDVRDADRSRGILRSVGLQWKEQPLGHYALLVVPKPDGAEDATRYPTLYWTEQGCFAADMGRFASRKANVLYEKAVRLLKSGNQAGGMELLQKALDVHPAHQPSRRALIEALEVSGRGGEAAANAATLKAQTVPQVPARIRFPHGIEFLGLALSSRETRPGGAVEVTYFWKCPPSAVSKRQDVFVHFMQGKQLFFLDDHKLLKEIRPEDLRKQPFDEILTERRWVKVPDSLSPGEYAISVGLYDHHNNERFRPRTDLPERHREVRLPVILTVKP